MEESLGIKVSSPSSRQLTCKCIRRNHKCFSDPFQCQQLPRATASFIGGEVLYWLLMSSRGRRGERTLQSGNVKIRPRYCPSAGMPLCSRMNTTAMIPTACGTLCSSSSARLTPAVAWDSKETRANSIFGTLLASIILCT